MSEAGVHAAKLAALADKAAPRERTLRPRDAGTLLIIDRSGARPRILMGRRAATHVFMAGRYVFPGGRVDPGDLALAGRFPLSEAAVERLTAGTGSRFDARRAGAIALAAVRETFEEVGIRVASAGAPLLTSNPFWQAFAQGGMRPDPARLVPIARAITPPGPPRRYDTRFFVTEGTADDIAAEFHARPTDEFDAVDWFTFEAMESLSLARITRWIIEDVRARLRDGSWLDASVPMPFYRTVRGRALRDLV